MSSSRVLDEKTTVQGTRNVGVMFDPVYLYGTSRCRLVPTPRPSSFVPVYLFYLKAFVTPSGSVRPTSVPFVPFTFVGKSINDSLSVRSRSSRVTKSSKSVSPQGVRCL